MTEEILKEFLDEKLFILIPVLWVIGAIIKQTEYVKSNFIPWILVIISIAYVFLLTGNITDALVQGIIVAGITVLAHQLVKQTTDL